MKDNLVEVNESFDGVLMEEQEPAEAVAVANEDFESLENEAVEYEQRQTEKKIAPVVKEAIKYHEDKLKAEVNEVLQEEVGYRLNRYEKRRRRRDIKDKLGVALKWVVVLGIIAFIYSTPQLRLKFSVLFRDLGDLITGLVNNDEVSSNQLVEDALSNLGVDLNEGSDVENEESPST
jgi:hypothetical protein